MDRLLSSLVAQDDAVENAQWVASEPVSAMPTPEAKSGGRRTVATTAEGRQTLANAMQNPRSVDQPGGENRRECPGAVPGVAAVVAGWPGIGRAACPRGGMVVRKVNICVGVEMVNGFQGWDGLSRPAPSDSDTMRICTTRGVQGR